LANGGAAGKKEVKDWVIAILVGIRKWHGYSRCLVEVVNLKWMVLQFDCSWYWVEYQWAWPAMEPTSTGSMC